MFFLAKCFYLGVFGAFKHIIGKIAHFFVKIKFAWACREFQNPCSVGAVFNRARARGCALRKRAYRLGLLHLIQTERVRVPKFLCSVGAVFNRARARGCALRKRAYRLGLLHLIQTERVRVPKSLFRRGGFQRRTRAGLRAWKARLPARPLAFNLDAHARSPL